MTEIEKAKFALNLTLDLLAKGEKILAIKYVRELYGPHRVGLVEANSYVKMVESIQKRTLCPVVYDSIVNIRADQKPC